MMLLSVCGDDRDNPEPVLRDAEPDIKSGKIDAVDPFRIIGIARTRVLLEHCNRRLLFGFRQQGKQFFGELRAESVQARFGGITLRGIRAAVRNRNIRLFL